ncbi:MAG TPA: hypothetical protein VE130_10890 [Nitrososphaeraceae archaeon]|nr:hypothetical protein [Nitrososphaeraceae archaeon]
MNEEIIFIGSAIAGSLLTVAIDRLAKPSKANSTNSRVSYESVRTELDSLEFERNLVAESAIKVDAAYSEKRIDIYERDKLLQQYSRQIEQADEKIDKYQNLLEFEDLLIQRNKLTNIINHRISSIDRRLREIHDRLVITYGGREGDRIEKVLEEAVREQLEDNMHDSKRTDETKEISTSPSNLVGGDRHEFKQLEELHHQIMYELNRLDEEKIDESAVDAAGNDTESLLENDGESSKKKETSSPP